MSGAEDNSAQALVEPLTRRERQILALLALGLSGPEIAKELTLAVSSVKWYVKQLYAKLGVNSKQQALARARALNLLTAAPAAPQPPATPASQHNLPLQINRFFGREAEIAQLKTRLSEHHLVTLTGPGGVGKTRLSLATAEALLSDFADGVWLVELAPLADPALVGQQIASSLGVRDDSGRSILESLTYFLRQRQLLLVLDNCEHLLQACAQLADSLLRVCPRLHLLASSREPLGIAGQAVISVPSLSFPDPDHLPPIEHMSDFVAVRLFLDRARLVLPDYQVTANNGAAIARICQRLDGIPLALELAATRLRVLEAGELAARLDDAFSVLIGGSRTALARQQTLRATINWSYALLSQSERLLLQRLSVFTGGCTLAAAEAICADSLGDGLEANLILERLTALVEKSMVSAAHQPGQATRYVLLETVRQFAREKLQDSGDGLRLCTRHRDYYLGLVEPNWRWTVRWGMVASKLDADRDNLRRALQWSFEESDHPGELEAGPKLVMGLREIWPSRQEQLDWYLRAADWCRVHPEISADLIADVLAFTAAALGAHDPPGALNMAEEAVAISRRLGPAGKHVLFGSLWLLGMNRSWDTDGPDLFLSPLAESEAILPELAGQIPSDEYSAALAWTAYGKAQVAMWQGRYLDAKRHAGEALRHFQRVGREFGVLEWGSQPALLTLGNACLSLDQYDEAHGYFQQAQAMNESAPGSWRQDHAASVPRWLALVAVQQGRLDQAAEYCRESLYQAKQIPDYDLIASNLGILARIAAQAGRPARAARLSGASQALWARQKRQPWEDSSLDTLLPGWRDGPKVAALAAASDAGQAMSAEEAMAYALSDG